MFVAEAGIPGTHFNVSRAWASKFMKAGFSLCQCTSECHKLPAAYEEKVFAFHRHCLKLHDSRQYLLGQIDMADQTPVNFNMTCNTTASMKAHEVELLTTGNERLRFTVMLDRWHQAPPIHCLQMEDDAFKSVPHRRSCVCQWKGLHDGRHGHQVV